MKSPLAPTDSGTGYGNAAITGIGGLVSPRTLSDVISMLFTVSQKKGTKNFLLRAFF